MMLLAETGIDWLSVLDRHGWPGIFVFVTLLVAWKLASYLAPKFSAFSDAIFKLLTALEEHVPIQTAMLKETREDLKEIRAKQSDHGKLLQEIRAERAKGNVQIA